MWMRYYLLSFFGKLLHLTVQMTLSMCPPTRETDSENHNSAVILLYSECEHETCSFWSSCRGQCHAVLTRVSHTCRLATPLPCLEGTSIGIWAEAGERFTGSSGVFSALRAFDCPLKHRDPRDHTELEMQQGVAMATAHFRPSLASSFTHLHLEMNYFTRWVDTWLKIHLWTQTYLL